MKQGRIKEEGGERTGEAENRKRQGERNVGRKGKRTRSYICSIST